MDAQLKLNRIKEQRDLDNTPSAQGGQTKNSDLVAPKYDIVIVAEPKKSQRKVKKPPIDCVKRQKRYLKEIVKERQEKDDESEQLKLDQKMFKERIASANSKTRSNHYSGQRIGSIADKEIIKLEIEELVKVSKLSLLQTQKIKLQQIDEKQEMIKKHEEVQNPLNIYEKYHNIMKNSDYDNGSLQEEIYSSVGAS